MKLFTTCLLGTSLALASPAVAQTPAPPAEGGYAGPGASETMTLKTVSDVVQSGASKQRVLLDGNVISKVKADKERYTFRDSTGDIVVKIDDKVFTGITITPKTHVRLTGKVETHMIGDKTVEVKSIEVIDPIQKAKEGVQGFFEELLESN